MLYMLSFLWCCCLHFCGVVVYIGIIVVYIIIFRYEVLLQVVCVINTC